MKNFKEFLNATLCGAYIMLIMTLPVIGIALYKEFGCWWVELIIVTIDYFLIEAYGRHYLKFNKHIHNDDTKLKIHHYVEDNDVWVESNDTIDSIIDIEVVKHIKLEGVDYEK